MLAWGRIVGSHIEFVAKPRPYFWHACVIDSVSTPRAKAMRVLRCISRKWRSLLKKQQELPVLITYNRISKREREREREREGEMCRFQSLNRTPHLDGKLQSRAPRLMDPSAAAGAAEDKENVKAWSKPLPLFLWGRPQCYMSYYHGHPTSPVAPRMDVSRQKSLASGPKKKRPVSCLCVAWLLSYSFSLHSLLKGQ